MTIPNPAKIHFRPHRGMLGDAMAECVEIEPTLEALIAAIRKVYHYADDEPLIGSTILDLNNLTVTWYGYDPRIQWNTWIIHLERWGVLGFTDHPLLDHPYSNVK